MEKDISTEEKIKQAARQMFLEKGYGQTRTRDIAEEAGINLALLNYYFRSKEKLFDIIMEESLHEMFSMIVNIVNDETTSLSTKIDLAVDRYTTSLSANPHLPLFVLSEIQANPLKLIEKIGIPDNMVVDSFFYKQIQEQIDKQNIKGVQPLHIFINLVSMSVFPIIGRPLLLNLNKSMDTDAYNVFLNERRTLIPQWIKMMLRIDE